MIIILLNKRQRGVPLSANKMTNPVSAAPISRQPIVLAKRSEAETEKKDAHEKDQRLTSCHMRLYNETKGQRSKANSIKLFPINHYLTRSLLPITPSIQ